jgi:hypothetical protein
MAVLFTFLIALQFLIIVSHDLIDIPGLVFGSRLVHGSQVQRIIGKRKVWLATLANSVFPGIAVTFAILFYNQPAPRYASNYWLVYCAVALASAIAMWYLPYLCGASEKQKLEYLKMYEGTVHILPERNGNPRPNLFHIGIHILFVVNFCVAAAMRLTGA